MAAIDLGVGGTVTAGGRDVLLLVSGWRRVMTVHGDALLRSRRVADAAGSAVVSDARVVGDDVLAHDGLVHIGVVNDGRVHAHYRGVIGEVAAAPLAACEADTHIAEAIVDAAV